MVDSYVSLRCQATARPQPIFTWIKDGSQIVSDDHLKIVESHSNNIYESILTFRPLRLGDDAIYQCLVNDTANDKFIQSSAMNISKLRYVYH